MNIAHIEDAVQKTSSNDEAVAKAAWDKLFDCVVLGESLESKSLDDALASGYLGAIVKEINREPPRMKVLFKALGATTWVCLSKKHAQEVAEYPNFLQSLANGAKKWIPDEIGRKCLACMKNLALREVAVKQCLAVGGLELALANLHYLDQGDEFKNLAIGAAQLVCRMVGKEETGPGPEAIKDNPKILEAILWIFTRILDVGPNGTVLGISWYPVGTVTDVASLCTSDRNKPLLGPFIPQIIRMLETRNENPDAVNRAVFGLSQLYFEPKCHSYFEKDKDRLIKILMNLVNDPKTERETKRDASGLLSSITQVSKPDPPSSNAGGGGLVRKLSNAFNRRPSATKKDGGSKDDPAPAAQHVMISYQWDSQSIARTLEEKLRAVKVKTWFDLNDMGENINDSMAEAVENAAVILVLFSRRYKESSNCRRECDMADSLGKPIIFIRVESNYQQSAWLALVMGKALWIDCTSLSALDANFPIICKRLTTYTSVDGSLIPTSAPVHKGDDSSSSKETAVAPISSSSSITFDQIKELFAGLETRLVGHIDEVKKEVTELKKEVESLKSKFSNQ